MTTIDIDYEAVSLQEQSPHERQLAYSSRAKLVPRMTTRKRLRRFVVATSLLCSVVIFVSAAINFCSMTENQKDDWRVTVASVMSYLRPGNTSPEWHPTKVSLKEELHQLVLHNAPAYNPESSDAVHWTGGGGDDDDPLTLPQSEWRRWLDENPVVEAGVLRS